MSFELFLCIVFFIAFNLFFALSSGGIAPRFRYACTVSTGFFNFLQNYALSYQVRYDQIHSTEKFIPEVNSKLERLLSLALSGDANVALYTNYVFSYGRILRIEKPYCFTGGQENGTVHFYIDIGCIGSDEKYALSPTVFILAEKVYKMQELRDHEDELYKKRNKI